MKRTTKIIIAAIAALFLLNILFYPIFFTESRKNIRETDTNSVISLTASPDSVVTSPGHFTTIQFKDKNVYPQGPSLELNIFQDPDITEPRMVMNKTWADNITVSVTDSVLILDADIHTGKKQLDEETYPTVVETDSLLRNVADIYLPASMPLGELTHKTNLSVVLHGYQSAPLRISW